jgi:hypothetical protein
MAWMTVTSPCWSCGRLFAYNADWVPSIRVNKQGEQDPEGERQPVCEDCMRVVNEGRRAAGLEPHFVHPDAYEPQEVP